MSNGVASSSAALARTWLAGTKINWASGSMNFLMSHGHATRSTFTFSRVIHFMRTLEIKLHECNRCFKPLWNAGNHEKVRTKERENCEKEIIRCQPCCMLGASGL